MQHVSVRSPVSLRFDKFRRNIALKGDSSSSATETVTRKITRIQRNRDAKCFMPLFKDLPVMQLKWFEEVVNVKRGCVSDAGTARSKELSANVEESLECVESEQRVQYCQTDGSWSV